MSDQIRFVAVVKEVKSKTSLSLDKVYRLVLETWDMAVVDAAKWGPTETVTVTLERDHPMSARGSDAYR